MGKRKVKNKSILRRRVFPSKNYMLGIAVKFFSGERLIVKCQDGKNRLCRILGKLKRRVWIREDNIVLVSPWGFQSDIRGDISGGNRKNQSDWIRNKGYLKM